MKSIIQLLITALIFLTISVSAFARSDQEVMLELLSEGYNLQMSRFDSLLDIIEKGTTWDTEDRWSPYLNLQRYYISPSKQLKILDAITRIIHQGSRKAHIDRLLHVFIDNKFIRSLQVNLRLLEIMTQLPIGEAQRLVALSLLPYANTKKQAEETLNEVSQHAKKPTVRILAAANLLSSHRFSERANTVLIQHANDPLTLNTVLYVIIKTENELIEHSVSRQVLDRLYELTRSFSKFEAKYFKSRINEIIENQNSKSKVSQCQSLFKSSAVTLPFNLKTKNNTKKK